MDRTEKLEYEKGVEQYLDDNKVYDLFEKLLKELIINKPEDPIDYLIERLKRKDVKRIFITGYSGTHKKEISKSIANALGYECVSMDHLIQREISKKMENSSQIRKNYDNNLLINDEIAIDLVRNQLIKFEEENCSYIIEGFPRNRNQAIFLQSIGLLIDNVIILTNTIDIDINIRAVKDIFSGFYCEIPVDKYDKDIDIIDELTKLLRFKNKTNAARRPPRIILATPPCIDKNGIAERICTRLKIIHVNIMDLLRKEIGKKNDNSLDILNSLEKYELVDDRFVLKLLEDRLYCSDCMINGWIVTGFPKTKKQIIFLEKLNPEIKPSLIAVVDVGKEKLEEKASKIKYDPKTGKYYKEIGENKYISINNPKQEVSKDIVRRLESRKQDEPEMFKKRLEIWDEVHKILDEKNYNNLLRLDGDDEENLSQLIIDAVGYNS
jgi:adenylate kinase